MPDNRKVAIFWDYENCPPLSSQGYAIVNGIQRIANIFGCVTTFKTYLDLSSQSSKNSVVFRSELQSSGVSITDCPHNGKKDVVDKMILVDMLAFAIDHQSPATVILIAGDRDYAYALSTLRLRRYRVILIVPSGQTITQSLQSQASVVLDWNYAILGKRPEADTPPFRQPCRDIDEDIVERLAREIRGSNDDPPVTLISSHPSSTTTAHTRSVSAAEPLEPSVFQQDTDSSDAVRSAPKCTPKKAAVSVLPATPAHSSVGSGASRAGSTAQSTHAVPDIDRDSGSPFTENDVLSDECISTANEIQHAPHDPFARPSITSPRLERYQNIITDDSILPSDHGAAMAALELDDEDEGNNESSLLAEVDDHSHIYAMNAVETRLNEGRAYSPANDTSPPLTETYRSPTSEESSLSSSASDSSVSIPDGETGPPQATPIISDNDTGYHALPMESVEDNIRRHTPPQFLPLINQLLLARSEGIEKASRTIISTALLQYDKDLYKREGLKKFKNYVSLAEQASLIELGGREGEAWIALHPNWFKEETTPSPTPSSIHGNSSSAPQDNIETLASFATTTPPPSFASQATTPNPNIGSPHATPGISDKDNNLSSGYQAPSITESVGDKIRRLTPPLFLPLIDQLLLARSEGTEKALRSIISTALLQSDKDIYTREGLKKFKHYASLAEQASLIELGGRDGEAWIALHPNWFKEETMPSPTPSSIHSHSSPAPQDNIETPASYATTPPLPSFASQATIPNPNPESPRATPGISDNNNHPSGYHALPIEPVEDKIRRLTPLRFLPLIDQLLLARSEGIEKASRTTISTSLLQYDKDIYKREGLKKFKNYASLAEEASLIELGRWEDGDAWIALHPNWFKEETTPSPTPSSSTRTPPPNFASRATTPNPSAPPSPAMPDEPMSFCFYPLITLLVILHNGRMTKPLQSSVGPILGRAANALAGVSTLKEYLSLAVQAGIVELGRSADGDWVMLHPAVISGEHSF